LERELNLNFEKFEKDMNDPATSQRVDKDYQLDRSAGVGGTPTIFINGSITKARALEEFRTIVEGNLEKAGKKASTSKGQ
jgi:protein-disulfide isomerase